MSQRDRDQLQRLIDRCTVAAPVDHVPLVELDEGETLLAVLRDVELIELRVTPLPLLGGSSSFDYGEASVLSGPTPQLRRGIELDEPVPARDRGALMLTDRRVSFVGTKTRHWSLARLQDITHDPGVPESWLAVSNRKRLSGVRYVGQAVEFRFALALAVADARGDRRALASSLRRQQQAYPPAVAPVAVPAAVTSEVVVQGRQRTGSRALVSAAVFGKPGVAMPLRVLQTVGVALVAIVLLALLVPGNDPSDGKDAAVRLTDAGAAAGRSAPPTTAAQSEAGQAGG